MTSYAHRRVKIDEQVGEALPTRAQRETTFDVLHTNVEMGEIPHSPTTIKKYNEE